MDHVCLLLLAHVLAKSSNSRLNTTMYYSNFRVLSREAVTCLTHFFCLVNCKCHPNYVNNQHILMR